MDIKRDSILFLFLLLFFTFTNSKAEQTAFYLASNGNDSNPGTKALSWKTVKPLNNRKFAPGDTVFFARGSNFGGGFVISSSGEPVKPIVFTSYGEGPMPVFSNMRYSNLNGNAIQVKGSYIIVDGLYFYNCPKSPVCKDVRTLGAIFIPVGADHNTGNNLHLGLNGNVARIARLKMEVDYNHNFVDFPEGSFRTNTIGIRMFYFFSTELYLKTYIQLNDDKLSNEGKERVISNFLLRWIYSPGSNLYMVYNDGRLIGPGEDEITNRTFMLKATFFWRRYQDLLDE